MRWYSGHMFRYIDYLLDRVTMYKLVLYALCIYAVYALLLSTFGLLPFSPLALFSSLALLVMVCYGSNVLFSKIGTAPINSESQVISALILFCILFPAESASGYILTALAGVVAMASKYVVAVRYAHICNPVAIALVLLGLFGKGEAVWWIGSPLMLPLVGIFGFLIVRKLKRNALVGAFLLSAMSTALGYGLWQGIPLEVLVNFFILSGPVVFFATVMLTEPLTTPATLKVQVLYGVLVGVLFSVPFSFGPVYSTPELALVVGNIAAFLVRPQQRFKLALKEKKEIAQSLFDFTFTTARAPVFKAGQYVECTLPHANADSRGVRRYFTIASSPTESEIHFGMRVDREKGSSFKKAMCALAPKESLIISGVTGDFTLPDDASEKLVFLAGGIGVTPFRSMIKYLKDTKDARDVVLVYASKTEAEFAYRDLFDHLEGTGVRVVYVVNEPAPLGWVGRSGFVTKEMLVEEIPDFAMRHFYISGPHAMVSSFEKTLKDMGVTKISTDFFPGYH